jgi:maleamate amidohydrolase
MTDSADLKANYRGVFDNRIGFGAAPAVLVIDFINAYTTPGAPLYAEGVVKAVAETVDLLAAARRARAPIVYTRVFYHPSGVDGGIFTRKVPVLRKMVRGEPLAEIVPQLPPAADDVIIDKQYASAFFGTPLAAMLTARGIDTVIITGCSTSGCVRASAVDAMQHGFRAIVPRECVGDRHQAPHDANLFDIDSKYGDVVAKREALDYLERLQSAQRAAE